ncbi:methyl-CpG-binding domain protein 4 isoform X2 [Daphnia magna]|uniref:methyl-CpG-binding domain protein 4 isoform X2 n=1 Tax=Daphnia magna TaxID=35525 RepID=UPI001E1BB602|nr:methyl-CpG-binding domain protein 4 isoform X2 [Daphnia magna]
MGMFTESPLFDDPSLPTGWYRKVVQRQTGATAGQWDVYVYNPEGKKFRSRNELRTHFNQIGSTMNSEDFDFSVKGKGHHNKDGPAATGETSGGGEQRKTKNKAPNVSNIETSGSAKRAKLKRKLDDKIAVRTSLASSAPRPKVAASKKLAKNQTATVAKKPETEVIPVEDDKKSRYFSLPLDVLPQSKDPRIPANWDPPRSPYNFIQEHLYRDPWQLLVATIFLNKTKGKMAVPLIWEFLKRWKSPEIARQADVMEIAQLMNPLGLHKLRAKRIIRMSEDYLKGEWITPSDLYGISKYGSDSYRIFCLGQWRDVRPTDIMLRIYQDWLFTNQKALKLLETYQSQ